MMWFNLESLLFSPLKLILWVIIRITSYFKHPQIHTLLFYTSFVYCRELAPSTVGLTSDLARGDDSKQNRYFTTVKITIIRYFKTKY